MEYPQHEGWNHLDPRRYAEDGRIILDMMRDPAQAQYSFDVYAEASRRWLRGNADRPFFLYLPYTIPHGALCVPELGRYADLDWPDVRHKEWAAMITRMDDEVGRLVALLKDLGVFDNTLIFFCSDNGYSARGYVKEDEEPPTFDAFFGHSGPFRGGKGNLNEGGLRVPMIAQWPGRVPAGQVCDAPWVFYDFLPTACELAGVEPPADLDGISIASYLRGNRNIPERDFFYWEFCENFLSQQAVRMGPWKAFRAHPDQPTELYAIEDDPSEQQDLAVQRPDVVRRGEELFDREHEQSPVFCDPGENQTAWRARMQREGRELRNNLEF
jgi:arylsulfatase A-like enzyme